MEQFRIKTTIQMFDTFSDFCEQFLLTKTDLLITIGHFYEDYIKGREAEPIVVDLRQYGSGEPSDEMVEAILEGLEGVSYHRVIAMGGGSILDVAKLFCLVQIAPVEDLFLQKLPRKKAKELIMIPTTCGTGSEVTNISILEIKSLQTKLGLADDALFADYAVLIPELMNSLPFQSFAASSMDAFIHAIESYLSPKANAFTRMYARKAMKEILLGYQAIVENGKSERIPRRKEFLLASTYAGISFGNAGCAAVHAMSYSLGSVFHIPHGEANYAMFHGVFARYLEKEPFGEIDGLNQMLADCLQCQKEVVYEALEHLFSEIMPRRTLRSYGVTKEQIQAFSVSVMENQQRLLANSYVPFTKEDLLLIYERMYE